MHTIYQIPYIFWGTLCPWTFKGAWAYETDISQSIYPISISEQQSCHKFCTGNYHVLPCSLHAWLGGGGGYLPQPLPYMAIQVRLAFRSHQGPKGGPLIPIPSGEAPLCSCGTFRAIALAFPFHFLLPSYLKSSLHP